ncbi:retrovirus-related Pol polyprotein from transposon 297 [Trichonephila clavipes]|nr:retrovirus-related Pol polyprotein from transposon 297 [Trichonephila clavipes]
MAFGILGAVPNFQKAIDIIQKPASVRFVSCYMDDEIMTSPTFNEHIDHLNQVFTLLRDSGLTVKEKGVKFNWSTEAHDSFNKVKRALTEAPVLQLPNFQEQFNLFTDACEVGIGATLNQNHRPIAFASRTLLKAEENYTIITDHFTKWSELIPLRKVSAQAIAKALFENNISQYGAPISLISDDGPQFISDVFEHLSHSLDIKHINMVTYRPQANLTERENRTLVQMIACFVEKNHDNWDRLLHEFCFALRTAVNETKG